MSSGPLKLSALAARDATSPRPAPDATFAVTKLAPPRHDRMQVHRSALLSRLTAGRYRPLTLVHAAAGAGKSTLLAQWRLELITAGALVAWYTLDEYDAQEAPFLDGLLSALHHAGAAVSTTPYALYQRRRRERGRAFADALVNECSALPGETYLVLDDFQHADDTGQVAIAARLIERAPPGLHVVIASRTCPDLPLAAWKAHDRVQVIDTVDLLFDRAETQSFLDHRLPGRLAAAGIARLHEVTEGWAAALQLAVIELQDEPEPDAFVTACAGAGTDLSSFLGGDILDRQPRDLVEFMLRVAVLPRFNAELCAHLTGDPTAPQRLREIERRNLFLVPLEGAPGWYRFHSLLRELLIRRQQALPGSELARLHIAASDWFNAGGHYADAVHHALAGRARERALDLVEHCAGMLVQEGRWTTLIDWFASLSPAEPTRRPALYCATAIAQILSSRLDEAERTLAQIAEVAASLPPVWQSRLAVASAVRDCMFDDSANALAHVRNLPAPLPADDSLYGAGACNVLAWSCVYSADFDRARVTLAHAARFHRPGALDAARVYSECFLGLVYTMQGRLERAAALHAAVLATAERRSGRRSVLASIPACFLAELAYERGDLEAVESLLADRLEIIRETVLPDGILRALLTAARTAAVRGDGELAMDLLYRLQSAGESGGNDRLVAASYAERVRLLLGAGDLAAARAVQRYLDRVCADHDPTAATTRGETARIGALSHARLAAADCAPTEAARALDALAGYYAAAGRRWDRCRVLGLRAVVLAHAGDRAAARQAAQLTLQLAAEVGLRRTLADESAGFASLGHELFGPLASDGAWNSGDPSSVAAARMLDPATLAGTTLSAREAEIVALIGQGVSNKRIASALGISIDTVKFHLKNVYAKLGVSNRTHAAERARALRLLP